MDVFRDFNVYHFNHFSIISSFFRYGGPGSQLVINRWKMEFNHVMASGKSYIVLEVDGAGTGGQGEANKMLLKHKLGQREVQDQLDTIK